MELANGALEQELRHGLLLSALGVFDEQRVVLERRRDDVRMRMDPRQKRHAHLRRDVRVSPRCSVSLSRALACLTGAACLVYVTSVQSTLFQMKSADLLTNPESLRFKFHVGEVHEDPTKLDKNGKPKKYKRLTFREEPIGIFHRDFYLPSIQKLKYHTPHRIVLGKDRCGKQRVEAFLSRIGDAKTRRDYAERLKGIFDLEEQHEHFGNGRTISMEGCALETWRKEAIAEFNRAKAAGCSDDAALLAASQVNADKPTRMAFHSHISDDSRQDAATTHAHMLIMIGFIRTIELLDGHVLWDDTDGCGKQYRCGTALQLRVEHQLRAVADLRGGRGRARPERLEDLHPVPHGEERPRGARGGLARRAPVYGTAHGACERAANVWIRERIRAMLTGGGWAVVVDVLRTTAHGEIQARESGYGGRGVRREFVGKASVFIASGRKTSIFVSRPRVTSLPAPRRSRAWVGVVSANRILSDG